MRFVSLKEFQSTPPRRGDHAKAVPARLVRDVSIHAPRRGDSDLTSTATRSSRDLFQSTPCEGATLFSRIQIQARLVSIHAPVKGRLAKQSNRPVGPSFNPRPVKGRPTIAITTTAPATASFNPRPREGATLLLAFSKASGMFQFTPPRRGDGFPRPQKHRRLPVSIHTPVKGRLCCETVTATMQSFQSTPR